MVTANPCGLCYGVGARCNAFGCQGAALSLLPLLLTSPPPNQRSQCWLQVCSEFQSPGLHAPADALDGKPRSGGARRSCAYCGCGFRCER
eukprot:8904880-Pyramimonas_sp.AAC.1